MMQWNYLYKSFDIDPQEPNLEVKDVLPRLPYLDVEIKEDLGYFYEEDLLTKIQQLSKQEMGISVLIVPPDKSIVIFNNSARTVANDGQSRAWSTWQYNRKMSIRLCS